MRFMTGWTDGSIYLTHLQSHGTDRIDWESSQWRMIWDDEPTHTYVRTYLHDGWGHPSPLQNLAVAIVLGGEGQGFL